MHVDVKDVELTHLSEQLANVQHQLSVARQVTLTHYLLVLPDVLLAVRQVLKS